MDRTHGGDWAAYESEYGRAPLDFSANVSPLGVPESVRAAVCRAAAGVDRYPDPDCRALRRAIAERQGVSPEQVLCGNGASDLIWRVAQTLRPKRALLAEPCFGEYAAALESVGCEPVRFPMAEPFRLSEDYLNEINHNIDLIILCNPNNPTGRTIEPELLREIARKSTACGARLLLDECFVDFLDRPERFTMVGAVNNYPKLLILNAFTKLYGMAGLRLGYLICADEDLLNAMSRSAQPWAVSHLAQEAGIAALRDGEYARSVRALIAAERPRLAEALRGLGLRVVPGEANYLLFQSPVSLDAPMKKRGVLLRSCADFSGLDALWYRVAVRTRADNERLIAALREVLTE